MRHWQRKMDELVSTKSNIPASWIVENLDVLCRKITKGATPTSYGYKFQDSGINFVKIENISNGLIESNTIQTFVSEEAHENQGRSILEENDILFSIAGTIGQTCIVRKRDLPANTNQALAIISGFANCLVPDFLEFQLRSTVASRAKAKARGGAMNNISLGDLRSLQILVPPLKEQLRIVAKIEELFPELDKGIASLKAARAKLDIYRQAVLKHAFEGRLTAQWREENQDKLEQPGKLLARIKRERETRYEQQLHEWKAAVKKWGKSDKTAKKPAKPKRLRSFSVFSENQPLNSIWPSFELGDLINVSSGQSLTSNAMRGGKYPVYGGNGINGYHDEYLISEPTLIIGRVGAKCGVTHITLKNSWITDNALIASPLVRSFDKRYFKYLLEHKNLNVLGSSTGQPVISGAKIYAVRIPLPTLAEQIQIADIIEKANSSIDELTTEIDDQLLQADVFRQSLLKKAFSGQLVPQDPNDEPASVLLDRIRAEIVKTVKNNHYKKTKKRKTTA